jgi:hypothetical protein
VSRSSAGAVEVSSAIPLQIGEPRQVRLEVHEDRMRELPSGPVIPAVRRVHLELRETSPPNIQWDR